MHVNWRLDTDFLLLPRGGRADTPPRQSLQPTVRILLEWIFVTNVSAAWIKCKWTDVLWYECLSNCLSKKHPPSQCSEQPECPLLHALFNEAGVALHCESEDYSQQTRKLEYKYAHDTSSSLSLKRPWVAITKTRKYQWSHWNEALFEPSFCNFSSEWHPHK